MPPPMIRKSALSMAPGASRSGAAPQCAANRARIRRPGGRAGRRRSARRRGRRRRGWSVRWPPGVASSAAAASTMLLGIGADAQRGARFDPLGPLGRVAQHQHRLAERDRLLLHAAGIGEDQVGALHQRGRSREGRAAAAGGCAHARPARPRPQRAARDWDGAGRAISTSGRSASRASAAQIARERRAEALAAMGGDQDQLAGRRWRAGRHRSRRAAPRRASSRASTSRARRCRYCR